MHIVHEHTAQASGPAAHRTGGVRFLSLLKGEEGTAGNYHLMLVHAHDYRAPRHRHNFDQLRIMLQGEFDFDRGQTMKQGMLGYFTEGTWYTQRGDGPSTTLLLQAGGASGSGYMSDAQLRGAIAQLQQHGEFADGLFRRADGSRPQDGYEAAWEWVHRRTIDYPQPLYERPVLWSQAHFPWLDRGEDGVAIRDFGSFTHRHLAVRQVRVAPGATHRAGVVDRPCLVYTICGEAAVALNGAVQTLRPVSAIHLLPGETVAIAAQSPCEFYEIDLMRLDAVAEQPISRADLPQPP